MASPPLLEFDSLIQPIPGDDPVGSVPFDVRSQLDEFRKEVNPDSYPEDDPSRPELKKADWQGVIRVAQETLANTAKDMMIAARLTEGLTKHSGFAGLRDGVQLMRRMVEECWDRMIPVIEEGDVEVRATAFNWLDDVDRGARFPTSIRSVALVTVSDAPCGWLQWKQATEGKGKINNEAIDGAVTATDRAHFVTLVDDLGECRDQLSQLSSVLEAKMESLAPGLLEMRRAIDDCATLAKQMLDRKPAPPEAAPAEAPVGTDEAAPTEPTPTEGPAAASPSLAGATSREGVYQQLAEVAALLQKIEPHSPIPYLLQRAVALGALPFPLLMKELIRDANVLTEMNRELGIKDAPPAEGGGGGGGDSGMQ